MKGNWPAIFLTALGIAAIPFAPVAVLAFSAMYTPKANATIVCIPLSPRACKVPRRPTQ
jgi:hypothetical protein